MKTCSKCKIEKDDSRFCVVRATPTRLESWCKDCKNESRRAALIKRRETVPRKNRISSEIVNENGDIVCAHCRAAYKPKDFGTQLRGWCRKCRAELEAKCRRERGIRQKTFSIIVDGQKQCMDCKEFLDKACFNQSVRGSGGLASYCKACLKIRQLKYYDRDHAREATAEYRKKNRERYLALHRVRQHEYRSKKKVSPDGTVTDDFLKSLYNAPVCYYCGKNIDIEQRTADHVVPLSKGGAHSAKNLVMACFSCNSSKRALSESEFKTRLANDISQNS